MEKDIPFTRNCCFGVPTRVLSPNVRFHWTLTEAATEIEAKLKKERREGILKEMSDDQISTLEEVCEQVF